MNQLRQDKLLKNNKLIIFTESAETGEDLFNDLNKIYQGQVIFYSGAKSNSI